MGPIPCGFWCAVKKKVRLYMVSFFVLQYIRVTDVQAVAIEILIKLDIYSPCELHILPIEMTRMKRIKSLTFEHPETTKIRTVIVSRLIV